jgi:hypothetical protein
MVRGRIERVGSVATPCRVVAVHVERVQCACPYSIKCSYARGNVLYACAVLSRAVLTAGELVRRIRVGGVGNWNMSCTEDNAVRRTRCHECLRPRGIGKVLGTCDRYCKS